MSTPDSGALTAAVLSAMGEAAKKLILPRYKQLAAHDIRTKSHPADIVTVADEESERYLTKALAGLWPGSRVVGEEAAAADAAVLDSLYGVDPVWIIDPIDGTANFVDGRGVFGMIVALARNGETVMGWIYFPLDGTALYAEKGAGAWRTGPIAHGKRENRRAVITAPDTSLASMTASIYHKALTPIKGKFGRVVRLGCAAHDYLSLVDGSLQVISYNRLKPWDHAAGSLIHAEAGGYNRLLSGDSYRPLPLQHGILCAPTREIWETIAAYQTP